MTKLLHLVGIRKNGVGITALTSLITPLRLAKTLSLIGTRAPQGWLTSDKVTSRVLIDSIGFNYGILSVPVRNPLSCGSFGIRQW